MMGIDDQLSVGPNQSQADPILSCPRTKERARSLEHLPILPARCGGLQGERAKN